jgi:hypothetical protein
MHETTTNAPFFTAPMKSIRHFILTLIISLLTGCAFGQKISYTGASNFQAPEKTSKALGLAVSDKRPAIVSGDHSLQWVGYSRPPLGIPYGVHTESGRPLSDDLVSLLQSTLANQNIVAQTVTTQPSEDHQVIVARLASYQNPRNILVTLNEWKTDSYVGLAVSLYYSVTLEVANAKGEYLGRSSSAGVKEISGAYPLSVAVTDIFQELFNAPEVIKALESGARKV